MDASANILEVYVVSHYTFRDIGGKPEILSRNASRDAQIEKNTQVYYSQVLVQGELAIYRNALV